MGIIGQVSTFAAFCNYLVSAENDNKMQFVKVQKAALWWDSTAKDLSIRLIEPHKLLISNS